MAAVHHNRKTIRPYLLGSLLLHGLIVLVLLWQLPRTATEQPKTQVLLLADLASPPARMTASKTITPPSRPAPAIQSVTPIRTAAPPPPAPSTSTLSTRQSEPAPLPPPAPTVSVSHVKAGIATGSAVTNLPTAPAGEASSGQTQPLDMAFGSTSGPRFSKQALPIYPALAKRRGREGIVLLRLSISATGHLTRLELLEDPGFGFAEATQTAIRNSSFTPALHNGKPVAVRAVLPVRFTLR